MQEGPSFAEEASIQRRGPITITSSTLSADSIKAVFEGSVVARMEDVTLKSDRMLVFYLEAGKVSRIEAEGNVRLIKGDKVVVSEKALFLAEEEKIIFTGQPRAVEGDTVVTGSTLIYMLRENRYIIKDSKVLLNRGKPDAYPQGR